jgi:G3E family GTPase
MLPKPDPLAPIPLVVLTGFLGAGKTTRLNAWLKHPAQADTLVVINEFGEIGLDHLLVEEAPGDVVLLAAGCLCCTLRGDLVATLEDLLRRRDNGRIRFFRQVVIETTGLADPLPVLQSVLQHPYLSKRFAIAGLITLVDAVHGAATLEAHPEARRQVALADAVLVTKGDMAPVESRAALDVALAGLSPRKAEDAAAFDPATLFQPRFRPGMDEAGMEAWLGNLASLPVPHQGIESFGFVSETPVSEGALSVFQEAMRVIHGPRLLRMKGLVALREHPERPAAIHQVQSVAERPVLLPRWPSRDRRTRLVFITDGISRETIQKFWAALEKAE